MPIIELTEVSKRFATGSQILTVLDNLTVSFDEGAITVITGSSGSGKSTLLNLVAGLDRVSSGRIIAVEREIQALSETDLTEFRARELGFVFQFHHLLNDFTAVENVMLPSFMGGVSRQLATENAMALLEEVGLAERCEHYPVELSGGERQRVALARALINKPGIILADEPTGNLDEENSSQIEELLANLVRSHGTTLLLVTHDQQLARLGDVRMHLDHGRLHPA